MRVMSQVAWMVVLGCLIAAPAQAGQFSFGLKAGANLARFDTDGGYSDAEYGSLTRMGGGVVLSVGLSPVLSLDTDLLYMQKGLQWDAGYEQSGVYYSSEEELKLAYAVISPMLKIGGRRDAVSPYFLAGGEVGYLLDARSNSVSWMANPENASTNEYDIKDMLEEVALGLVFGGGIDIPTSGATVFVEGRYVLGLSNIWPSDYQTMGDQKSRDVYLLGGCASRPRPLTRLAPPKVGTRSWDSAVQLNRLGAHR